MRRILNFRNLNFANRLSRSVFVFSFVASLFSTVSQGSEFAGGIDVGNGGDAVMRDGRMVLRDFAMYDVVKRDPKSSSSTTESPTVFAQRANSFLLRNVSEIKFPERLTFDRQLLALKLTDLDQAMPGLGLVLVNILKSYSFLPIDRELTLIDDPSWNDEADPRIQIAVRLNEVISIDADKWRQLDDLNKIGLLLHEAIYSLTPPTCLPNGTIGCSPNASMVREVTAYLFSLRHFSELRSVLLPALGLKTTIQLFCRESSYELVVVTFGVDSEAKSSVELFSIAGESSEFEAASKKVCSVLGDSPLSGPERSFSLSGFSRVLQATRQNYIDSFGYQLGYQLLEHQVYFTHAFTAKTRHECSDTFNNLALSTQMDMYISTSMTKSVCEILKN